MNCPNAEQWDLLAMDLLEEGDVRDMLGHARACEKCRALYQKTRREHVERMRMYEAFDREHDELRDQLMAVLPIEAPAVVHAGLAGRARRRLGDIAMSLNRTKRRRAMAFLAPAACIVIAVAVFLTPKQSVFAAAIEHMRQASTIVCDLTMYMNESEEPVMDGTMYMSDDRGARVDLDMGFFGSLNGLGGGAAASQAAGFTFLRKPDGPALMIQPQTNVAIRMYGLDELSQNPQTTSPDEFIRHCLAITGEADRSLGQAIINERIVEGFEISGERLWECIREQRGGLGGHFGLHASDGQTLPEMALRLWIDVENNLPVRIEADVKIQPFGASMRVVHDGFEWDAELDADLFEVEIPEGMREIDMVIPPMTEETLIEGLRLHAEAAGYYPSSLDPSDIGAQVALAASVGRQVALAYADAEAGIDPAEMQELVMRNALTLGVGFHFVQNLEANGQAPEYFGDIVSPADTEDVLLQWRLDDGRMRLIYGDLSAETVETTD